MKLRNKKTGEIIEKYPNWIVINGEQIKRYNSLTKLNEDWEDMPEEPKEYWFINDLDGKPMKCELRYCPVRDFTEWSEKRKQIGNYFETKEEAEKAVEKLKAWKRLRDKGFRFIDHIDRDSGQGMTRYEWDGYVNGEDLDLLFGGEE